jgi:putative ABC transport system permease protein
MIDVLLLRPLPYPDAKHLLRLYETKTANDKATQSDLSPGDFIDWQEQARTFSGMAASEGFRYSLTGNGPPEQVWGGAGSADWFKILGVHPQLGRDFLPEEDRPGAAPAVLLSDRLWRRKYQGDGAIIGRTIRINGDSFTVIGVLPKLADFRPELELWIPLHKQVRPDRMLFHDSRFLVTIARIKTGFTEAQAQDELNRIAASIRKAHPTGDVYGAAAIAPLQESINADMRPMLLVSLATVALVLLVACANVTNLMLLRVAGRTRELAIRMALGANPGGLIRQLVVEGICLGASAGVEGLAIGAAGKKLLLWQLHWDTPDVTALNLTWPVLLFTFGVSVAAGVIFALVPAMTVVRAEMYDLLRRASFTTTVDVKGRRLRQGFVIAEIACSMVLLAGTGLLVRSLQSLQHVSLGFDTDHRVLVGLSVPRTKYQSDPDVVRFYQQVVEKMRGVPGVMDATFTHEVPLDGDGFAGGFQIVSNGAPAEQFNDVVLRLSDSHTLSTFSIPLLRGRFIAESDSIQSEPICVINRAMANKYWPNQDPLGQLIVLTRNDVNGEKKPRRVIGIAADTRDVINEEPQPQVYVPYAQVSFFSMVLMVHTRDSVAAVRQAVSGVLQSVDPDQPIRQVRAFSDLIPGALADWRVAILLLGGLAGIAILLTVLGVFAVIAYMVRERSREIGIRMAIGADRRNIRNLVLLQTVWLAIFGVVLGAIVSASCTRLLGSLVYGVSFADPLTFLIVTALIGSLALLASYIPARRAMQVDPMQTLRSE